MDIPFIHEFAGGFSLYLRECSCALLQHVLDPAVPFVWVRRHWPFPVVQWDRARVPLSSCGELHELEVRGLEFEILLPTARFLDLLPEFEEQGMILFQMRSRVPDTLTLRGLSERASRQVLAHNGLHLRFELPHAGETARIEAPARDTLSALLNNEVVRQLAISQPV